MEPRRRRDHTADALERRVIAAYSDPDGKAQSTGAMLNVLHYVALLREASGAAARYAFKLELDDGRWDVAEQELESVPRVGDVVRFDDRPWKVLGTQIVRPRPASKPPCEIFVCAPVA